MARLKEVASTRGGYTDPYAADVLAELFGLDAVPELKPRYNVAPTEKAPVVTEQEGRRKLEPTRWGLVPHWASDRSMGNRLINARSETVAESGLSGEASGTSGAWSSRRVLRVEKEEH